MRAVLVSVRACDHAIIGPVGFTTRGSWSRIFGRGRRRMRLRTVASYCIRLHYQVRPAFPQHKAGAQRSSRSRPVYQTPCPTEATDSLFPSIRVYIGCRPIGSASASSSPFSVVASSAPHQPPFFLAAACTSSMINERAPTRTSRASYVHRCGRCWDAP